MSPPLPSLSAHPSAHTSTPLPDGLILDTKEKIIYIIEDAWCSDTDEAVETDEVTKIHKHRAMREELLLRYQLAEVRR